MLWPLVISAAIGATSLGPADRSPSLVVLGLRADRATGTNAPLLNELLLTEVQRQLPGIRVFSPADLEAMLDVERLKDAVGCDDVACASEIGGALGAQWILIGHVGELGSETVIALKVINLHRAEVAGRSTANLPSRDKAQYLVAMQRAVVQLGLGVALGAAAVPQQADAVASQRPRPDAWTTFPARMSPALAWTLTALGVGVAGGSVAMDVAAPTSTNHELDVVDFVPVVGYVAATVLVAWGIEELFGE